MATMRDEFASGVVVKLDRGYPLVRLNVEEPSGEVASATEDANVVEDAGAVEIASVVEDANVVEDAMLVRCEHATSLVKNSRDRAVIGDNVAVRLEGTHDKGIIEEIKLRQTQFTRRDPADRTAKQVLAANFTLVILAEPILELNLRRLERALVLAHQTGARVMIALTKSDTMDEASVPIMVQQVRDLAGDAVDVIEVSVHDKNSIDRLRQAICAGEMAILIGKSGVGKSSLVNALAGRAVQETAAVREADGKGRHTTVDRVLVEIPGGGCVVDMPGVRGLGVWEAQEGLQRAFADIEQLSEACRFRDCTHSAEPGCAVLEAIQSGSLAAARLESYRTIVDELNTTTNQRKQAQRMRGEKHSTRNTKTN